MNHNIKNSCAGCPYVYSTDASSYIAGSKFALESFCLHPSVKDNRACSIGFSTELTYCDTPDWCPLLDKQVKENNEDVAEIIPAKKANQIAEEINELSARDELKKLNDSILKAAGEGEYEIYYEGLLSCSTRSILEKSGYKVNELHSDFKSLTTHITWYLNT